MLYEEAFSKKLDMPITDDDQNSTLSKSELFSLPLTSVGLCSDESCYNRIWGIEQFFDEGEK
uniref:Uncharacterized protein n=1 Tax=Romanomermis culicivorax TaxID=13658 RepID=A0A915HJF5_ROMCU